jgi:hypothetical protein
MNATFEQIAKDTGSTAEEQVEILLAYVANQGSDSEEALAAHAADHWSATRCCVELREGGEVYICDLDEGHEGPHAERLHIQRRSWV